MAAKLKDPDEVRTYGFAWTTHLGADTIVSQTTTVPSGIVIANSAISGQSVLVTLSGGTAGEDYDVTNTIVTSASETLVARGTVAVRQRFV